MSPVVAEAEPVVGEARGLHAVFDLGSVAEAGTEAAGSRREVEPARTGVAPAFLQCDERVPRSEALESPARELRAESAAIAQRERAHRHLLARIDEVRGEAGGGRLPADRKPDSQPVAEVGLSQRGVVASAGDHA